MGSRLNVPCVKTPLEEGVQSQALEKPQSLKTRWAQMRAMVLCRVSYCLLRCGLAAMGTGTLMFQRAAHLTHLGERYGNGMACIWEKHGKPNRIPDPSLAKPERRAARPSVRCRAHRRAFPVSAT